MEKTTKKKKKTKSLRRRIGIIAVGGLSLVMTVCLSVGATLAWFAGSTWSDENLYMGGPVYIEMAGRGGAAGTNTDGSAEGKAKWLGGTGSLDIQASTQRSSGTAYGKNAAGKYVDAMGNEISDTAGANIDRNVLLPGQKFEIYSQARVYSTATTDTISAPEDETQNSGSNTANKASNGTATHMSSNGRITTTTTSVIRARFSISIEFDPSVGFGNFTDQVYMENYPTRSGVYNGDGLGRTLVTNGDNPATTDPETDWTGWVNQNEPWQEALVNNTPPDPIGEWKPSVFATVNNLDGTTTHTGRRDYVDVSEMAVPYTDTLDDTTKTDGTNTDLSRIQAGTMKSIYSWKYVSKSTYTNSTLTAAEGTVPNGTDAVGKKYIAMGAPFDGTDTSSNVNGYYGVWILTEDQKGIEESESFYKARCNAYLQTYVEEFKSEYGNIETKTIANSIQALESELNQSFVNLVNDSSDDIIAGYTNGFTVAEDGTMQPVIINDAGADVTGTEGATPGAAQKHSASWLYIDPTIGNDTNTNEISTATGGWWYLVASDNQGVQSGNNLVRTGADSAVYVTNGDNPATTDTVETNWSGWTGTKNKVDYTPFDLTNDDEGDDAITAATPIKATAEQVGQTNPLTGKAIAAENEIIGYNFTAGSNGFSRNLFSATNANRLTAMLYEVKPNSQTLNEIVGNNNGTAVKKIVSNAFPFVNGSSAIPGDALTNVFANAKISFQISFQAVQAFLPYSTTIDNMTYTNPLLGTAKALTIKNAIPVFNEAFDYQENTTSSSITGL